MEPYGLDWVNPEGTIYLPTWLVFEGFFDTFGTPPLLGRTFHPEEHERGGGDVVVLGYTLWKTRFAGAEEVVGRVLALDGRPHTVIGVMPEGFAMPSDEAVWAPKVLEGWEERSRTSYFYTVFGRLRTGIGLSEAAADLDTVAALLSREYPRTNAFSVTERLSSAPGVTAAAHDVFGAPHGDDRRRACPTDDRGGPATPRRRESAAGALHHRGWRPLRGVLNPVAHRPAVRFARRRRVSTGRHRQRDLRDTIFPGRRRDRQRVMLAGTRLAGMSREIVGVVGDVRRSALHEAPRPGVYLPHAQAPTGANAFIVRGGGRPAALLEHIRRTIWQLNPAIAIYHETTMDDLVGASVQERRFLLVLLSSFAAMALVLAAAGIFGLMSFIIAQRTREYGFRLALGALREEVFSLVLKRGMTLAATGIALGLLGALALTRPLAGMLYDVSPFDPVTFALAVLVLCSTATVASLYPATRATGVNLNDALRND